MRTKLFAMVLLLLSMSGQIALAEFNDVSSSHSYFDAINYGQTQGIIAGYPDGNFLPDNKINRAEFMKIVIGSSFAAGDIDSCLQTKTDLALFTDVTGNEWFAKYLCLAKRNGVVSGYPDGSFRPSQYINFAEAAKIISIAKNGRDMGSSITDQQSDWYQRYVSFLANVSAIPATVESVSYQITRGEMMEIIYRLGTDRKDKFSLTYDQVAGSEMACIKAGSLARGTVAPPYQTHCCSGLYTYYASRSKGQLLMGGATLCLEPVFGLDQAIKVMGTLNQCTENVDLGQTLDPAPYKNANFNGFSFPLTSFKDNCAARCDVNLDNQEATIGWMCMGALIN